MSMCWRSDTVGDGPRTIREVAVIAVILVGEQGHQVDLATALAADERSPSGWLRDLLGRHSARRTHTSDRADGGPSSMNEDDDSAHETAD